MNELKTLIGTAIIAIVLIAAYLIATNDAYPAEPQPTKAEAQQIPLEALRNAWTLVNDEMEKIQQRWIKLEQTKLHLGNEITRRVAEQTAADKAANPTR